MTYEAIIALWPVFTGIASVVLFGIVWGLRLEGKHQGLAEKYEDLHQEHLHLRGEHNALNSKTLEEIAKMREQLARIETALMFKGRRTRA